ncbi:MAG: hypothetical protein MI810_14615 [Flavobacteriales bacterium]|jgi:hypothetical protein|nr:hypothetical protein [Flavobacteriales bacterium]
MLRILNILFLFGVTISFAQKKEVVHFSFVSAETNLIGEKVKKIDEELYGVYIPNNPSADLFKIVIDQRGIYYLNNKMQRAGDFYNPVDANHVLYKEEGVYWLFKKESEEDKTYKLYSININRKQYAHRSGLYESVVMEADLVEELMDFYKAEKIKAKFKDGVIALPELDEEMLAYKVSSPDKQGFTTDKAFSVAIKDADCVGGKVVTEIESNQYDQLSRYVEPEHKSTGLQMKLVIDESGMYTTNAQGENAVYIFKPNDENYALKKIDRFGYVALMKQKNGFYRLLIFKPNGQNIEFSAIKEGMDHGFFSDSENRLDNGQRLYLLCDLDKYLKYGTQAAGSYAGSRTHW